MIDIHGKPLGHQEVQGESLQGINIKHRDYLQKYNKLLSDDDFDRIDLGLKEANIFTILGIQRMEIRHSNFLAWMFDPSGSHGMGNLFLHRFLRDISLKSSLEGQNLTGISVTSPKTAEIRREWRNIDILVILDKHVICIENKVDSSDHGNQLSKYKDVITREFPRHDPIFVYLTPDGRAPNDEGQHAHYINYSYENIVEHTGKLLRLHGRSLPANVKIYIEDYTRNILRNLMKQDQLNDLASKLYVQHKEVLDFIFDNRPDIVSQAKAYFTNLLINRGYVEGSQSKYFVRFLTKELEDLLPKNGDGAGGWSRGEVFTFELNFYIKSNNRLLLNFQTVIHPSMNDRIREVLVNAVQSNHSPITTRARFTILIRKHFTVLNDITEGVTEDSMAGFYGQKWPEIISIVDTVSKSILQHRTEIKSCLEHTEN
jgi:hypothetical protein